MNKFVETYPKLRPLQVGSKLVIQNSVGSNISVIITEIDYDYQVAYCNISKYITISLDRIKFNSNKNQFELSI